MIEIRPATPLFHFAVPLMHSTLVTTSSPWHPTQPTLVTTSSPWPPTQVAAQPEEAVELYLAADRPRQALSILNQQVSAVMPRAADEVATGLDATGM
jgi:hypothetical protein